MFKKIFKNFYNLKLILNNKGFSLIYIYFFLYITLFPIFIIILIYYKYDINLPENLYYGQNYNFVLKCPEYAKLNLNDNLIINNFNSKKPNDDNNNLIIVKLQNYTFIFTILGFSSIIIYKLIKNNFF